MNQIVRARSRRDEFFETSRIRRRATSEAAFGKGSKAWRTALAELENSVFEEIFLLRGNTPFV
ncbi:MAG: hypothetical protein ACLRSW_17045 [Christensenellaceae bacterium]